MRSEESAVSGSALVGRIIANAIDALFLNRLQWFGVGHILQTHKRKKMMKTRTGGIHSPAGSEHLMPKRININQATTEKNVDILFALLPGH